MRRTSSIRIAAVLAAIFLAAESAGGAEDPPEEADSDLIEFLGSFDDMDDDWLVVNMEEMAGRREESGDAGRDDVETSDDQD
ncbi:MAG: hypothetical protein PVG29_02085 [Gammaproteobacteria bacterium]